MNIYLTLDYELFFGNKSGSVEKCMIQPTDELLKILDPYDIKMTCFVDVGYLVKLEEYKDNYPKLQEDYNKVTAQIKHLANNGHGIELHIHPHWEDSYFEGNTWVFNTDRYKLADFSSDLIERIVTQYTETLYRISGKPPKAYRAGGWSAQPFKNIGKALAKNNIYIDSTVFSGGYYQSPQQFYDFRNVPSFTSQYSFSEDLTKEQSNGNFTEIPISSYRVSPLFFWKFAYHKLRKNKAHQAFGDGFAIEKTKKDTLRLMMSFSNSVVSVDGYKASFIEKAFKVYQQRLKNKGNFVLIGHPKAFTSYSLKKTEEFIQLTKNNHNFSTFRE